MSITMPQIQPSTLVGRSVTLPSYGRPDLSYPSVNVVQTITAGLVTFHKVPGSQFEIVQQITFSWKTSAVVGVRTLGIVFNDSAGDVIGEVLAPGQQSENTQARYTFALDLSAAYVPNTTYVTSLPYMLMQPTQSWQLFGTGLDAGDIQNGLTHTELVIPTGPPVEETTSTFVTPVIV